MQQARGDAMINRMFGALRKIYFKLFKIRTKGIRGIVVDGDKILLVQYSYPPFRGQWFLPGGGLRRNEAWEEGLKREILEETGFQVTVDCLLGEYQTENEGKKDTIRVYVCKIEKGQNKRSLETSKIGFYSADNLPDKTSPGTRRRIQEYIRGQRNLNKSW